MYKIKKQFRFFFNFEKEEAWLNQMSQSGWHLQGVSAFNVYTFIQGEPQNRNYRIDCRLFRKKKDLSDYISLFADSGWVSIATTINHCNHYFYSKDSDSSQDIFSDKASKARRYLRLSQAFLSSGVAMMIPYISININTFYDHTIGYQTPNIWAMPFDKFIKAFLIETPFVIFRVLLYYLPIVLLLLFACFVILFYYQYKKDMREQQ